MYSSITEHLYSTLHYVFSFLLLFSLVPRFVFQSHYKNGVVNWFSGYVKTTFLLIISGYILVVTKLYEVPALLLMISIMIVYRYKKTRRAKGVDTMQNLLRRIFDVLDGVTTTNGKVLKTKCISWYKYWSKNIHQSFSWPLLAEVITLVIILGISVLVRFYDTFINAAPPLSDSYVTLAWMKYINNRELFHDGIYPQGFHIYLASIYKFAAIDPLYILRYTGPLNTVMITAGLYVVIRKVTNNPVGGLAAAWMYGIVLVIFPFYSMERQAATNSQEFAFVFIFPAAYFLLNYFQKEKKEDLVVGLLSTAIIGLVHSLGFALIGLMIGIMIITSVMTLKSKWKPSVPIIAGSILAVILSLLPIGIGYLLGRGLNSSSAEYLVENNTYLLRELNIMDKAALGSLLLLIFLQFRRKLSRAERFIGVFTMLTGGSVFTLYFAGGMLTHSTLVDSRSFDLWGLILPFCIGISISYFLNVFRGQTKSVMNILVMGGLITNLIIYRPSPIIPYKLEYNENIEQYLRITDKYLPQTWMIVSQDEGYSVSLGKGFHLHLGDFLKAYNPKAKTLTKYDQGVPDQNIPPHIFIFQEKKVFEVSKNNSIYSLLAPKYKERAKEYKELTKWMKLHKEAGNKVTIFYENQNIIVYQLDLPKNTKQ